MRLWIQNYFKKKNIDRMNRMKNKFTTQELIAWGLTAMEMKEGIAEILYKELCERLYDEKK